MSALQFSPNLNVFKMTHCSPSEEQVWALGCRTGGLLACLTGVARSPAGATPWPLPFLPWDSPRRSRATEASAEGREKGNSGSAAPRRKRRPLLRRRGPASVMQSSCGHGRIVCWSKGLS